jgi:hypothetical protein
LSDADRKQLVAALPVLTKLKGIIERKLEGNIALQERLDGYANPNWPYVQADHIATQRTLKDVIKIITPDCK